MSLMSDRRKNNLRSSNSIQLQPKIQFVFTLPSVGVSPHNAQKNAALHRHCCCAVMRLHSWPVLWAAMITFLLGNKCRGSLEKEWKCIKCINVRLCIFLFGFKTDLDKRCCWVCLFLVEGDEAGCSFYSLSHWNNTIMHIKNDIINQWSILCRYNSPFWLLFQTTKNLKKNTSSEFGKINNVCFGFSVEINLWTCVERLRPYWTIIKSWCFGVVTFTHTHSPSWRVMVYRWQQNKYFGVVCSRGWGS